MLRPYLLPILYRDHWWYISPITGSLIKTKKAPVAQHGRHLPRLISAALLHCEDPYLCRWDPKPITVRLEKPNERRLSTFNRMFLRLGNRRFFLSILYAGISHHLFENTQHAMGAISMMQEHALRRDELCLPRTLLAAKTSKTFQQKGVIFIGALITTGDMHAWIIEDGRQPDPEDRFWINFRPLLAYAKS